MIVFKRPIRGVGTATVVEIGYLDRLFAEGDLSSRRQKARRGLTSSRGAELATGGMFSEVWPAVWRTSGTRLLRSLRGAGGDGPKESVAAYL